MKFVFGILLINSGIAVAQFGERLWRMANCEHMTIELSRSYNNHRSQSKYHCVNACQKDAACRSVFFNGVEGICYRFDELPNSKCKDLRKFDSGQNHEFFYKSIQCKNNGRVLENKLECECSEYWTGLFCQTPFIDYFYYQQD